MRLRSFLHGERKRTLHNCTQPFCSRSPSIACVGVPLIKTRNTLKAVQYPTCKHTLGSETFRMCVLCVLVLHVRIVHPESFRSYAQITIAFAHRNRPFVHCNDEFACVDLRSRAFAFAFVCEYSSRSTACAYVRAFAHTYVRTCTT